MYIEFEDNKVKLVNGANILVKTLKFSDSEDVEDIYREVWQLIKDKHSNSIEQE